MEWGKNFFSGDFEDEAHIQDLFRCLWFGKIFRGTRKKENLFICHLGRGGEDQESTFCI